MTTRPLTFSKKEVSNDVLPLAQLFIKDVTHSGNYQIWDRKGEKIHSVQPTQQYILTFFAFTSLVYHAKKDGGMLCVKQILHRRRTSTPM
uniref:Uncharacterized protein n=1 Tax=Pyxicephalus adspersus TaxID=30357 RepID=A0AAV3AQU8_PYXAD|nr:TPA: hypothetical protein GDO54_008145 [Pyxicephalus adspersus]